MLPSNFDEKDRTKLAEIVGLNAQQKIKKCKKVLNDMNHPR
jgi:hypothetical protein